jgi:hypothetical protein
MRRSFGVALAAVCALAGCGPGNGLTMGRVSGTVTFNGKPVELGEVLFVPDSSKGNSGVPSMGPIGKDGRYIMSTQDAGDGVIAGYHKVAIRALDPNPLAQVEAPELDPDVATGPELMKDKLSRRQAQAQTVQKSRGKKDAPETVNFRGKLYRFLAPKSLANPETSKIRVQISRGSNTVNFAIKDDGSVDVSP